MLLSPRGGKIYQVLREPTLSLHPTSLLTQMAEDQKDDTPIFVEGRGEGILQAEVIQTWNDVASCPFLSWWDC
jgi:hypothetical protein